MKILSFAAFTGSALLLASQALAGDTSSNTVVMSGDVPKYCVLGTPEDSITGNAVFRGGLVSFDNFTDTQDGRHYNKQFQMVFPSSICNYAAYLGLQSEKNGMKPAGAASAETGFVDVVHYTATASWGSATTTLTTSAGPKGNNNAVQIRPFVGDLTLKVVTQTSTKPLIADGSPYIDSLIIQLGSQL